MRPFIRLRRIQGDNKKVQSLCVKTKIGGQEVLLIKPQTFMNHSGEAVKKLLNYYKIPLVHLWVVYDDVDLALGSIKIKPSGKGKSKHNGVRAIVTSLKTPEFIRFRVGIGKEKTVPTKRYVLEKVRGRDKKLFDEGVQAAADAIIFSYANGLEAAMVKYNTRERNEE